MIDLAQIERLGFSGSGALTKLDSVLGEVASYAETRTAAEIAGVLERKMSTDERLKTVVFPFLTKFRALALPLIAEEQVDSVFQNVATVVGDERIGLYERLRARLLVLPRSKRRLEAQRLLEIVRSSKETLGTSTVGSWMQTFERTGGAKDPRQFFALPEFQRLDDTTDHALRHLVHIATLLSSPDTIESAVAERPAPPRRKVAGPPPVPANLPVGPAAEKVVPPPPVSPAPPRPMPAPTVAPAPRPALSPEPTYDRGPTMASVIARLQQSEQATAATVGGISHLTPEDQEEIRGHVERLSGEDIGPNVHDTLDATIDRIISDTKLTFPDEHLRQRFTTILTSRLKDIRTSAETLELLTRSVKIGGMGLEEPAAQKIVDEASREASKFHDEEEVRTIMARQRSAEREPMPKPPVVPRPVVPEPLPAAVTMRPTGPTAPMAAGRPAPVRPPPRPFEFPRPTEPVRIASATMPTAAIRPPATERPTVADIRGVPRLVGPVEELRMMSLVDFRRLGPDPVSCVRRVYEKIQRLGKESFTKKAEGIRGWRESETYRLYVSMGQESLLSSKSLRDIIVSRQQLGQPTLSEQEFALVADLNRKLRF